jgi:hypothetical protein
MIVLLMFLYPSLGANQLVGTDLAQAIPLTGAAALGALAFGHVALPVTSSIILGAVPAVLIGSLLSSRIHDGYLRPVIGFVILASGLKYVGVDARLIGWIAVCSLVAAAATWAIKARPWRWMAVRQKTANERRLSSRDPAIEAPASGTSWEGRALAETG